MSFYYGDLEEDTINNMGYRRVIYTGKIQLVLMSLEPGEDIPVEVHEDHDQFIRVERGYGMIQIGNEEYDLAKDQAVIIPAGYKHYVKNTGETVLKLYTIYGPAEHPKTLFQINPPK